MKPEFYSTIILENKNRTNIQLEYDTKKEIARIHKTQAESIFSNHSNLKILNIATTVSNENKLIVTSLWTTIS